MRRKWIIDKKKVKRKKVEKRENKEKKRSEWIIEGKEDEFLYM